MSSTVVVAPIMRALKKAEEFMLGPHRQWNAVNDAQQEFLEKILATRNELARFSNPELRAWASWVAEELNAILKKEGFDIQLQQFQKDEFGVVSILDVMVEWLEKGQKSFVTVPKRRPYPAVRMEPGAAFAGYKVSGHNHPVVMLPTKSGDKVFMTVADEPLESFVLMRKIDTIKTAFPAAPGHYAYLLFPMIDLNQQVDIAWLKGMWTTVQESPRQAVISQALQQTKFKMNEVGARVRSAVAIGMKAVVMMQEPLPLIIDRPFYLWIERAGVTVPILYAYLDYTDWKDPGTLEM